MPTNAIIASRVRAKLFAAGDIRRGQSLVVWAIREGRQAAHAIDQLPDGPKRPRPLTKAAGAAVENLKRKRALDLASASPYVLR